MTLRRSKTLLLHDWMRNANNHILSLAMKFMTFMMVIFVSLPGTANADNIDVIRMTKFINEYVRIAFGPDRPLLKKLEAASPIAASYECDGIDAASCNAAFENMHSAIRGSNNLRLDFQATPPIIKFVFAKSVDLASRVEAARQEFGNGFADTSDSDCVVFTQSEGSKIQKILLLFSVDQPELKLKLCMAGQFEQALGLNAFNGAPFSQQWSSQAGGWAQTKSEEDFETGIRRIRNIEYVHMCPELRPGMTPEQVVSDLSRHDSCVAELFTQ